MPQSPALGFLSRQEGPRLAAARMVDFSSPSESVGWKTKPSSTPTSSPSTRTVPSVFTEAIKFFFSFNLRLKCAARRSTNLSDNRLCRQSEADPQFDGHDPATGQGCLSSQNGV